MNVRVYHVLTWQVHVPYVRQ